MRSDDVKELREVFVVAAANPRALARNFNSTAAAIAMAFERRLANVHAHGCWRVCISCRQGIAAETISIAGGCLELPIAFDFEKYFALCDVAKKEMVAETIVAAVRRYATTAELQIGTFERIRKELAAIGYDTQWYHGVEKWNRPRTMVARIRVAHEVASCRIVVEVSNSDGRLVHAETVASVDPSPWDVLPALGKARWRTRDTIEYSAKSLERSVVFTVGGRS